MGQSTPDRARHLTMLAGLVFISLIFLARTLTNSDKCSPNSLHMSDTDCHVFYHCSMYGRPITKSCGALMFNDNDKVCDWPANVMKYRSECDPDKKKIAGTDPGLVKSKEESNENVFSDFSEPKKERKGQREISLPLKGQNDIKTTNSKTVKKMPFVPGIQQPNMVSPPKGKSINAIDTSSNPREQKEMASPNENQITNSKVDFQAKGSDTKWTVARVRPAKPAATAKPRKQLRNLGMKKDVTKMGSGKSTKDVIRSSRRFFMRKNQEALRRRRQFFDVE